MAGDDLNRYRTSPLERGTVGEFSGPLEAETSPLGRRGFLKAAGFSFAGAVLAGCQRAPVEKAIPYLVKPEELIPGRADYYASTCDACSACCGVLVKNRDGRPIKLEGNPEHPGSRGGLCAVGQASILGLYDSQRLKHPLREGNRAAWDEVDRAVIGKLEGIRQDGGAVRLLTGTISSPTTLATIDAFLGRFANSRHVAYDPLSSSAILDAHQETFGIRLLPRFRLEKAAVIVSFDADFLGTWISPVEHTAAYQAGRDLETLRPRPSYHVQFESRMSLTGSKADQRIRIAPRDLGLVVTHLAALLAERAGEPIETEGMEESPVPADVLWQVAERLWESRGRSLIVCGSQAVPVQVLCNFMNRLLENYGATIDVERPSYQRRGNDRALRALLRELNENQVAALFVAGVNPAYELPEGDRVRQSLQRVPLMVSLAERLDETSELAHYVCPNHHYLESWGDREPVSGVVSLLQPCSRPLGDTRQIIESLAAWMGEPKPAYDMVREHWRAHIFPRHNNQQSFRAFWDRAVHDGVVELEGTPVTSVSPFNPASVRPVLSSEAVADGEYVLVLYPKAGMLDGRHAYNPWLQELPDPITKITWDNYACLAPAAAKELGVEEGDVVRLETGSSANAETSGIELPVVVQPGQHDRVVAVALGYGSKATERFAEMGPRWLDAPKAPRGSRIGTNAAPLIGFADGTLRYAGTPVRLRPTGKRQPLAATQTHHTVTVPERLALPGAEGRSVIEETTLADHQEDVLYGREYHEEQHADLWPQDHQYTGRRWAMAIDLNACTGCSACVVSCQVENNISVVGRDEVRRRREMHWLRIDRYYSGDGAAVKVAHQPMLCQHCENAPCETVCPVLATVHSEEGLNQQIYNRCVGTRYCANNCPYKVRRFNWFDYCREDRLANMVLNPDVTVRSRGVMEKCTFCAQRIQEASIEAKREGKELSDGSIQTACQQSCPANAIVFGDMNDPESRVSALRRSRRRYQVLGELNVRPSVAYLKLVRHRPEGQEGERHG